MVARSYDSNGQVTPEFAKKNRRDDLAAYLLLNMCLLVALCISALVGLDDSKMFSFGWTYRLGIKDSRANMYAAGVEISNMYCINRNSSPERLAQMLGEAYHKASCKQSMYEGGIEWSEREASPTCNCLRNMHVQYAKAVNPDGVRLKPTEFNTTRVEAATNSTYFNCFVALRNTQLEGMEDPLNSHENAAGSSNIVANVCMWNGMGCLLSFFLLYFDGLLWMEFDGPESVSIWGWDRVNNYVMIPLTIIVLGLCTGLFVSVVALTLTQVNIGLFITSYLIYMTLGVVFLLLEKTNGNTQLNAQRNPVFKMVMIWLHFAFCMPVLATTVNVLLQRRDAIFNAVTVVIVFATGLSFLAIDMIQYSFTPRNAAKDELGWGGMIPKKNFLQKSIMSSGGVVVATLCMVSMPIFPSVPFSNAYHFAFVVAAMAMLQLVLPARYLREVSDATIRDLHKSTSYQRSMDLWDLWPLDMVTLELVARVVFTFAVMCDTWAVKVEDGHPMLAFRGIP